MPPFLFFLFFLARSVSALLTPAHFSASFLLNLSSPFLLPSSPSCGSNLGSDSIRLDTTATLPSSGSESLSVSPTFYFHGGQRCRRTTPDHAAFFVLHPGLHEPTLTGKLKEVADAITSAVGRDAVVTAEGAHLREAVSRAYVTITTIVPGKNGARVEKVAGQLLPGPVRCGMRDVSGVVYARAGKDTEVKGGDGRVLLRMVKGRMYAAVETGEGVCFYDGFTRAPEGDVVIDEGTGGGGGEAGGKGLEIALGVVGIVALAAVLAGVFGVLYYRARRREMEDEREETKELEGEEEIEELDAEIEDEKA